MDNNTAEGLKELEMLPNERPILTISSLDSKSPVDTIKTIACRESDDLRINKSFQKAPLPSFTLRPATEHDYDIFTRFFPELEIDYSTPNEEFFRLKVLPFMSVIQLYINDDLPAEPVGYLAVVQYPIEHTLYIHYFVISKEWRGKGLGTKVLCQFFKDNLGTPKDSSSDIYFNRIGLDCDASHDKAMNFYKKMGFKKKFSSHYLKHWQDGTIDSKKVTEITVSEPDEELFFKLDKLSSFQAGSYLMNFNLKRKITVYQEANTRTLIGAIMQNLDSLVKICSASGYEQIFIQKCVTPYLLQRHALGKDPDPEEPYVYLFVMANEPLVDKIEKYWSKVQRCTIYDYIEFESKLSL